jgi:hypothetical protein
MEAVEAEGQLLANAVEAGDHPGLALAQQGDPLGPAGGQVDGREGCMKVRTAYSPLWETRSISR